MVETVVDEGLRRSVPGVPMLGRERAVRRAAALLARARAGRGGVLVLEGPAGIGKTRVLSAIVDAASGFEVRAVAAAPLEREFPFGLVHDLLGDLGVASTAHDGPADRRRSPAPCGDTVRELFRRLSHLARRRPVLLAIDDVHWADEQSARLLAYVARRIASMPIAVVLSRRPSALACAPVAELLGAIEDRVALEPLSEQTVADLLELAQPGLGRLAVRCREISGGIPWFVVEACRALAAEPHAAIETLAPWSVASIVAARLHALGADAVSFAQAVAVLGADARVRPTAALARLDVAQAARAGDMLASADLLAPACPLAFAAPMVRNVVYDSITPLQRGLLHGTAVRLLSDAGVPRTSVAHHVLLSEPAQDPAAVELLRSTASESLASGDSDGARRYLERALAEPPPTATRPAVLLELGAVESRLCQPAAAAHLAEVLQSGCHDGRRAAAVLELADLRLVRGQYREAAALIEAELPGLQSAQPELARVLRAVLALCRMAAGASVPAQAAPRAWWRVELARDDYGPAERALAAAAISAAALAGDSPSLWLPSAERAFAEGTLPAGLGSGGAAATALWALRIGGQERLATRTMKRGLGPARFAGSVVARAAALTLEAGQLLSRGALVPAELAARRALALSRANQLRLFEPSALASLLESILEQGRLRDAERELIAASNPQGLGGCLLLAARGRLRGACGQLERGLADVLAAGARLVEGSCRTPAVDWRSRAGLLAHRLERPVEAARLIDEELALARKLGEGRPLGLALRARALVSAPGARTELLEDAVELLGKTTARVDHARALCELGSAYRRSGNRRSGRAPLEEGLQVAHECGAFVLAERARHELVALGARPRRHAVTGVEALTARERRAGELAAEGLTNRQIAAAMSVTPNTVEYHLTNTYRKLGIETRSLLAPALGLRHHPTAVGTLVPDLV